MLTETKNKIHWVNFALILIEIEFLADEFYKKTNVCKNQLKYELKPNYK